MLAGIVDDEGKDEGEPISTKSESRQEVGGQGLKKPQMNLAVQPESPAALPGADVTEVPTANQEEPHSTPPLSSLSQ